MFNNCKKQQNRPRPKGSNKSKEKFKKYGKHTNKAIRNKVSIYSNTYTKLPLVIICFIITVTNATFDFAPIRYYNHQQNPSPTILLKPSPSYNPISIVLFAKCLLFYNFTSDVSQNQI